MNGKVAETPRGASWYDTLLSTPREHSIISPVTGRIHNAPVITVPGSGEGVLLGIVGGSVRLDSPNSRTGSLNAEGSFAVPPGNTQPFHHLQAVSTIPLPPQSQRWVLLGISDGGVRLGAPSPDLIADQNKIMEFSRCILPQIRPLKFIIILRRT